MHTPDKPREKEVALARTLGIPEVALLGVGALLGGGIFTLLGPAAGLAGGGLVFAMLIGAAISYINLNAYIALATTFPEAGGGYLWVKEGLGDLSGFLAGWCSWLAHAVACALYAASFGFIAEELVFNALHLFPGVHQTDQWAMWFAIGVVLLFGMINYRGVIFTGKIGAVMTVIVLGVLGIFVVFALKAMSTHLDLFFANYSPLLPNGIWGVLQAAALFYIAFEGSEIQAQTGEEVKDPARSLKIGLFLSWAIVSVLYMLTAFVVIAATDGGDFPSWMFLNKAGEHAMTAAGTQLLPFGQIVMLVGGLIANLGALNVTIYSSSRVLFAMGRDHFVFSPLGKIHPIFYVPTRALLLSLAIIIAVIYFFSIADIAGLADMLFITLFLQLNLAYIQLRRQKPEAKWHHIVPLEPYLPILAVVLYVILGVALFHISPVATILFAGWILLGLVNYLGYAKRIEREAHAREVVYEHSLRFHPKSEYRVVMPIGSGGDLERFTAIASAMTRDEGGDLIALRIHEMNERENIADAFHTNGDTKDLRKIEEDMAKQKINTETRIIAAHSVPNAILETIAAESADLVLLNWDGSVDTKGFIFGRKIDTVLQRAKCDLLAMKLGTGNSFARVFIPVAIDANPNLRFTGRVATALYHSFGSRVTVAMVVPEDVRGREDSYYAGILKERIHELKMKIPEGVETQLIYSDYLASGILKAATGAYDVILLPSARSRITRAIGVGTIPEQVAKNCRHKTVLIAKGYRGIAQPFWEYIRESF